MSMFKEFTRAVTKVLAHPVTNVGLTAVGGLVAEQLATKSGLVDGLTNFGMAALGFKDKSKETTAAEAPPVAQAPAAPPPVIHVHAAPPPAPAVGGVAAGKPSAPPQIFSTGGKPLEVGHGHGDCGCNKAGHDPAKPKCGACAASAAAPAAAGANIGEAAAKVETLKQAILSSDAYKAFAAEAKAAGLEPYAPFAVAAVAETETLEVGSTLYTTRGGKVTSVNGRIKIAYPANCGPHAGQVTDVGTGTVAVEQAKQTLDSYASTYGCGGTTTVHHTAASDSAYKKAQAKINELQKEKNSWHTKWANEKNSAQRAQYQAQIDALQQQIALAQTAQGAIYTNPLVAQQLAATPADSMMQVMQQMLQMKMFEQMLAPAAAPAAAPLPYGYPPQPSPYGYPAPSPYGVPGYGYPPGYADPSMYDAVDPNQQYQSMMLAQQGIDPAQAMSIDPGLVAPDQLDGNESFDQDLAYSFAGVEGVAEDYTAIEGDGNDSGLENNLLLPENEEECGPCNAIGGGNPFSDL